jgi:ABC-type nickel/cobalt efflux system permease component RcnA
MASAAVAGDLTALASEPEGADAAAVAGDAPADELAAPGQAAQAPSGGFFAQVAALQASFTRDLNRALKALRADGSAFWWLAGISFAYGIVHAAGPGHGKVVISSYLLANEQRLRRGIGVAFLSAFLQALVAVGIVGLMAVLLNMTSMAMQDAAAAFETASYALVAALGLYLLTAKGRRALAMVPGSFPSPLRAAARTGVASAVPLPSGHGHHAGHHHHDHRQHDHGPDCGCAHHADPATLDRHGWSGALAAVLSVGLRPCSGALVVLVFALAQGIFWAGVASTFLMALGTAVTVAILAGLAVGAKDVALRLAGGDGRRSARPCWRWSWSRRFSLRRSGRRCLPARWLGSL